MANKLPVTPSCDIPNCNKMAVYVTGKVLKDALNVNTLCEHHYIYRGTLRDNNWRRAVLTRHKADKKNKDGTVDENTLSCRVCNNIGDPLSDYGLCVNCTDSIVNQETRKQAIQIKAVQWYLEKGFGKSSWASEVVSGLISYGTIKSAIQDRRHDDGAHDIAKRLFVDYVEKHASSLWVSKFDGMEEEQKV